MDKIVEYFRVFADENRLKIIELLLKGETCSCTLIDKLPISQPTLSYHLSMLASSGLANTKRDGNKIEHFINRDKLDKVIAFLQDLRDTEAEACKL
jgi:ArsR family transcriptional regulator, arsenate/arsenite/antimonite-responsive transcriptional repressor